MPFCGSCGKEVDANQKFCEHCGSLQESPSIAVPGPQPLPQTPTPGTPTPASGLPKNVLVGIGVIAVVAAIVLVYLSGLPLTKGTGQTSTGLSDTAYQTPTSVYPSPATTIRATTTQTAGILTQDERYSETYETIYTKERRFDYGAKEAFTHDLTRPPLSIRFNLTPHMVTSEKLVDIGTSAERTIYATYTDPNAWFEVNVIDADTGAIVESRGFNKEYSIMTRQEFMVRTKGNYRIEMAGNGVFASIQMLIGTS